jgi:WD40 repeat protein
MKNSERERWMLRYLSALDRGDLNTLSAILRHAEADALLAQMIADTHHHLEENEIHEEILSMQFNTYSLNGSHPPALAGHPPQTTQRRGSIFSALTGAAAAVLALFLCAFLVLAYRPPPNFNELAQVTPVPLDELQPITPENIDQLVKLRILGNGGVTGLAWSPDGATLAVATSLGIYLHNANDLSAEPVLFAGVDEQVTQLRYSHSGNMLTGVYNRQVWVWEAHTGEVRQRIVSGENDSLRIVEFNPDETQIALSVCGNWSEITFGCEFNEVRIHDIATGSQVQTLEEHSEMKFTLDWSFAGYIDEPTRTFRLIDVETGELLAITQLDRQSYQTFVFTPDNTRVIFRDRFEGESLAVRDIADLLAQPLPDVDALPSYPYENAGYNPVLISPDGERLIVVGAITEGFIRVYDIVTSIRILNITPSPQRGIYQYALNPDGTQLAIVNENAVQRVDLASGEVLDETTRYGLTIETLDFTADRSQLLTANGWPFGTAPIQLWDLTNDPITATQLPQEETSAVYQVAFTPDETGIVYGPSADDIRLDVFRYDLATGERQDLLETGSFTNTQTFFITSDNRLLTVQNWGVLRSWPIDAPDEETRVELYQASGNVEVSYMRTVFAQTDESVLVGQRHCGVRQIEVSSSICDQQFWIWDAETGQLLQTLRDIDDEYTNFSERIFDPQRQVLIVSGCSAVETRRTETGRTLNSCASGEVRIWDIRAAFERAEALREGETLSNEAIQNEVRDMAVVITGFEYMPNTLALHPASTRENLLLAAGVSGSNPQFWQVNIETGEHNLLHTLEFGGSLAFSDDGELLAVGRYGYIELWGVPQE